MREKRQCYRDSFYFWCDSNKLHPAHFRHPNEVGGAYWLFSMFLSLVSLPLVVQYYQTQDGKSENYFIELAQQACYVLLPVSMISFITFFLTINRQYWKTFFSIERGKDFTVRRFLSSDDDTVKAEAVFCNTQRHWNTIKDAVNEWVRENWEKWKLEQSTWFQDEGIRANIPTYMIPNAEERNRAAETQKKRRRSSVANILALGGVKDRTVELRKVVPEDA